MFNIFRFLHTSDWHFGRQLFGKDRCAEFEDFLNWLKDTMRSLHCEGRHVDALIIAGDLYNSSSPSSAVCKLYNDFVTALANDPELRPQVIAVAGNHDANRNFDDVKELMTLANAAAVGSIDKQNLDGQIVTVQGREGQAVVMAVPFLLTRDMRTAEENESLSTKEEKLKNGIREHYAQLTAIARERARELGGNVPVIATGHLFATGGKVNSDSGEENLYVGTALEVDAGQLFPADIDYAALGHLHIPQTVGNDPTRRYSGSPLPMGFGEAKDNKVVCLVECTDRAVSVEEIAVPRRQELKVLRGSADPNAENSLFGQIDALKEAGSSAWLQVICTDKQLTPEFEKQIREAVRDSAMEVLEYRSTVQLAESSLPALAEKSLDDFEPLELFDIILGRHGELSEETKLTAREVFIEVLGEVEEERRAKADAGSSELGTRD